jgi:hypothetical protein
MVSKRASGRHAIRLAIICLLLVANPAFGYKCALSSQSIREAYFLGRKNDAATAEFMRQYVHHLPVPRTGAYIAEIRLETPYAEVVERAQEELVYTAQDATREFLDKPCVLRLYVKIYFTPSYTAILRSDEHGVTLRSQDFWHEFKFRFLQANEVPPEVMRGQPIFASSEKGMRQLIGNEVYAEYSAKKVAAEPTKIEVLGPSGSTVEAVFDLSQLR